MSHFRPFLRVSLERWPQRDKRITGLLWNCKVKGIVHFLFVSSPRLLIGKQLYEDWFLKQDWKATCPNHKSHDISIILHILKECWYNPYGLFHFLCKTNKDEWNWNAESRTQLTLWMSQFDDCKNFLVAGEKGSNNSRKSSTNPLWHPSQRHWSFVYTSTALLYFQVWSDHDCCSQEGKCFWWPAQKVFLSPYTMATHFFYNGQTFINDRPIKKGF